MIPQDAMNRRNDATIRVVSLDNDPWCIYRGRYVEFNSQNGTYGGIYGGLSTLGKLVLCPFIEMRPLFPEEQRMYNIPFTLQWKEDTMLLSSEEVSQAIPRSQEYIEGNLRHFSIPLSPALTWEI